MKRIRKTGQPLIYSAWCKQVRGSVQENWRSVYAAEKEDLLKELVNEQGKICAYTMKRINLNTSHPEHIKPQSICREEREGSDLEYANLVACFPRDGMASNYRYGAQKKGNWWENDGHDFISPLSDMCEYLIRFRLNGEVYAYKDDNRARTTIQVLDLNHSSLKEDRKRVIREYIYGRDGATPISKAEALRLIENITNLNKDAYPEFCIAVQHALHLYVAALDKAKMRKQAIAKSINIAKKK